jgi:hypothetical protein
VVASAGSQAASLAGRMGDGIWSMGPNAEAVETFSKEGGDGKPRYAQAVGC